MKVGAVLSSRRFSREWPKAVAKRGQMTVDEAVTSIAAEAQRRVVASIIGGTKSGRIYRRYKPPRIHQASAPFQAPANDLGKLARSYVVVERKINQYAKAATLGSSLVYAAALEYGAPERNLLPRPHLRPVIRTLEQQAGSMLVDHWIRNAHITSRSF